ncbi:MAG TPA: hypothetical protein VGO62_03865, partial [Myxococcota bacterium]
MSFLTFTTKKTLPPKVEGVPATTATTTTTTTATTAATATTTTDNTATARIAAAAVVVGAQYGANNNGGVTVPTMRGGNGGMLRHKLLEEMTVGDVLEMPIERTFLDSFGPVDAHRVALTALERARRAEGIEPLRKGMVDSVYDGAFAKDGRAWESVELAGATIYVGGMNSNLSKTFGAMAALQRAT